MSTSLRTSMLAALGVSPGGLSELEVEKRRAASGWNELPEKRRSMVRIFLLQFHSVLIYILLVAAALSVLVPLFHGSADRSEWIDAPVILAIIVINAILGMVQEWKAEHAIAALRALSAPRATVRRGGRVLDISARELVPGDLMLVEAGNRLAADARIVAASSLEADESMLTGESQPVAKRAVEHPEVSEDSAMGSLYSGTLITRGSGEAVVLATALQTEIGKITSLMMEYEQPPTPLQRTLAALGRRVGILVLGLCSLIFVAAIYRGIPAVDVFFIVVSLAVAAVPEGLPAVATICLAIGVQRMARRHALLRKMDAVETLGAVTVICADKTGTITENRMTVQDVWCMEGVSSTEALQIAASCNRAELPDIGDPTELGLLRAASEHGVDRLPIAEEEVPFTSEGKYMVTRHDTPEGPRRFLKGAPEVLARFLPPEEREVFLSRTEVFTRQGLRVLGLARGEKDHVHALALVTLMDPPRSGAKEAIERARIAGIRTVMITGDHPSTALSVAASVGIRTRGVLTGVELDSMDDEVLQGALQHVGVFARVLPAHKARILGLLQSMGEIVCMSGDGVNDAPALKRANVGVGMGMRGTDVAREAAAMVLTDDDFSSIVAAIEEGRRIYTNIRKVVLFLLRSNAGEIVIIAAALALDIPLPLLPLHILWINLVTDSLPALALAMERKEPGSMRRPPRSVQDGFLKDETLSLIVSASLNAALALVVFSFVLRSDSGDLMRARTAALTATILFQMGLAFSSGSSCGQLLRSPLAHRWLFGATLSSVLLHVALLSSPLAPIFSVQPLSLSAWMALFGGTLVAYIVFEGYKCIRSVARSTVHPIPAPGEER